MGVIIMDLTITGLKVMILFCSGEMEGQCLLLFHGTQTKYQLKL